MKPETATPFNPDGFFDAKIFEWLTDDERLQVLRSGFRKQLFAGCILFRQGEPALNCYLVNSGQLKITQLNDTGKEVIMRYVGAGELTGAVAVLRDRDYPVTAETVEETDSIGWDKRTMVQIIRQYPDMAIRMLTTVLDRLDEVQHRYLELCSERVEQRIARTLLRLMQRAGQKTADGIWINIPLSRQSIADYAGTTLFTASRTLSGWEKNNWIKSGKERIVVVNPHALVLLAENA